MKYFDEQTLDKIRKGYYSAVYFNRTKQILEQEKNYKTVTMQIFQKKDGATLCGVSEVLELIDSCSGYFLEDRWIDKSDTVKIESLKDGEKINGWEPVMHITGPYVYFAHLESIYLGIFARRTLLASNTRKIVEAANGKPVIFFGDRFDYFLNQEGDGYAAHIGGVSGVCTAAHGTWWEGIAQGTIPHSLIAINNGDTIKATILFEKYFNNKVNIITLVDFENDCVKTSLEVARKLKGKLWGVRLDTAENLIDKSLQSQKSNLKTQNHNSKLKPLPIDKYYGVNPTLVKLVRNALDKEGFEHVKIIVSGGFFEGKVKWFENEKAPVDIYGVGSGIVHGENDFTADVVMVEGRMIAKAGRECKKIKSSY